MMNAMTEYTTVEMPIERNVPCTMLLAGSLSRPEMLAPAMMPVTAGKKIANTEKKPYSFIDPLTIWGVYLACMLAARLLEPGTASATRVPLVMAMV